MISFEGQVVVITGGGGGLGSAFAKDIARRGGKVVVNDLGGPTSGAASDTGGGASSGFADRVVAEIREAGGAAIANYDTVTTPEGAEAIIGAALATWGRVDAVILNAGTMRHGAFETMPLEDLNALLAVHVGGAWTVAQAAWPHMKAQGYGRLVFATSSGGTLGNAYLAAYGAAKGAVMGLMHGLAEAGVPHGIVCNAYMPNAISRMTSEMTATDLGENPWSARFWPYFAPEYTTGLATFLASSACTTHHGIYSALGGRIGRVFIGAVDGVARDEAPSAEDIAADWARINDAGAGYAIPANQVDEWRIVAEQRGV
jgi:NAD(P)-dependent dehydrogenase (short-subunit alcohol dehydrogenase family)